MNYDPLFKKFDDKFPPNCNGEMTCKRHGGIAVTIEVKDWIQQHTLPKEEVRRVIVSHKLLLDIRDLLVKATNQ